MDRKDQIQRKSTLIGSAARKHAITIFAFPLSYTKKGGGMIVQFAGTVFGEPKSKQAFLKELSMHKRILDIELTDSFLIGTIEEPAYASCLYKPSLFHLEPALISEEGYEQVTIGSFKRNDLKKVISVVKERYGGTLLSIQKKPIRTISIMKVQPTLTRKQHQAMERAIREGYYRSPRKTDVKGLAAKAGLSFSTFQVHLRKAEQKLIPYYFG